MKKELLERRKKRNAFRIKANNKSKRPILNVFKSNKNIYAQIIGLDGKILLCVSSKSKSIADTTAEKTGIEIAEIVGTEVAKIAKNNNIVQVVFNKGPYLYIGRVKALAEAARQNGLDF
jgi:large subunit ribosomal protein L18